MNIYTVCEVDSNIRYATVFIFNLITSDIITLLE